MLPIRPLLLSTAIVCTIGQEVSDMKALEKMRYKAGQLIQCSENGDCPLFELCEFWNESREKCQWPDIQDKENERMEIPW